MPKTKIKNLKLSDYGISKHKYLELKLFCMQYQEKKAELDAIRGLNASASDGQPRSSNISDTTADKAIKAARLSADVNLIEETAEQANKAIKKYLIKSVTEGIAWEYLGVPMSKFRFYDYRRYFYYLLAQKR